MLYSRYGGIDTNDLWSGSGGKDRLSKLAGLESFTFNCKWFWSFRDVIGGLLRDLITEGNFQL